MKTSPEGVEPVLPLADEAAPVTVPPIVPAAEYDPAVDSIVAVEEAKLAAGENGESLSRHTLHAIAVAAASNRPHTVAEGRRAIGKYFSAAQHIRNLRAAREAELDTQKPRRTRRPKDL